MERGTGSIYQFSLNPEAKDVEVFMVDSLPQKTNKVIRIIAHDLVENLYSTDKQMIEKYFWMSSKDKVIPRTAAYYIGYLVVKDIAKEYSLADLVRFDEKVFVPKIEMILRNL